MQKTPPQPSDFSDSTRAQLEALATESAHRKWLGEIIQRWAKWIAAVAVGATIVWDALHRLVTALGPK